MSTVKPPATSESARRRAVARSALRVTLITALLVLAYYLLPLGRLGGTALFVALAIGLVALIGFAAWHIKAVLDADDPSLKAVSGFFIFIPLFIVLTAAWYYAISRQYPHSFTTGALTKTDSLYFTMTVFSTVGFGDVSATSQLARALVTIQMVVDLVILGLGVRVLTRAVKVGAARHGAALPQEDD
jgi:voltage-gated potassium channel